MNFSEQVKTIRLSMKLTQKQFAAALNVSVPTINRWENEKTKPSHLAQNSFIEFCKNNSIKIDNLKNL